MKVLVAKGTDRILGATIVSERAGNLIHEFALAMKAGFGLKTISQTMHVYPTYAEVTRKLADHQQKKRLTGFAKRITSFFYRRGKEAGHLGNSFLTGRRQSHRIQIGRVTLEEVP